MNKKAQNIILLVYLLTLVVLIAGASFAYFTVVKVSSVSPTVEAGTAVTNYITFSVGDFIYLNPTTENLGEGMGNLDDSTYASASLRTDYAENTISVSYRIYLDITTNTLEYTTDDLTAELILTVTDPNGEEVTEIAGLEYVSVGDISGFDITMALGEYDIVSKRVISTNSSLTETWNVTVTFVNLDSNQQENTGKSVEGYIKIEQVEDED